MADLIVIGGGLAGSEAAWQAAERGLTVDLYEMRPQVTTGAHLGGELAELICSNSLGSDQPDRAPGVLKNELRRLGSLLIFCADRCRVPAGSALAVDRGCFSSSVTQHIQRHPRINLIREEMTKIPNEPCIVASGPLTSPALASELQKLMGENHLFFYDAIAPIVEHDSINFGIAFRASRYERGESQEGDYINCPMTVDEYLRFVTGLLSAERIQLKDFELGIESGVTAGSQAYFEGCLPVEILAGRGREALAFGPLRPVGLIDPRTGKRPYAVVQLRQDDLAGALYNLVGFQTNLTFSAQREVFRLIPGLEKAEFVRYGQMHRNTFINSPRLLYPSLQYQRKADLLFCGQITGIEGYAGNIASGLLAGWNAARIINGKTPLVLPPETMLGALCYYITHATPADFQPMKANFGILPDLNRKEIKGKRARGALYASRAVSELEKYLEQNHLQPLPQPA